MAECKRWARRSRPRGSRSSASADRPGKGRYNKMYWQREFLRFGESWPNGGTLKLDLPKIGLLGSIQIHARRAGVTDAFNTALKWRLIDYISKAEVLVKGSEIIHSVTGEGAKAPTFFNGGGGAPAQGVRQRT